MNNKTFGVKKHLLKGIGFAKFGLLEFRVDSSFSTNPWDKATFD